MPLTKIQNVCFHPVIEFTFSYAIQENYTACWVNSTLKFFAAKIRGISVFRVKFNVEFTRQAVQFSIETNKGEDFHDFLQKSKWIKYYGILT